MLETPLLRPSLEEMVRQCVAEVFSVVATGEPVRVAMNVKTDLTEISSPLVSSPITLKQIEEFTHSQILKAENIFFELIGDRVWKLIYQNKTFCIS